VGLVVVPQAMAYALLARLPPAFGLYTTFTGACVYWIFGTSKDIVIGVRTLPSILLYLYAYSEPLLTRLDYRSWVPSCR
jgi:sodium-independent sulfate anion transporter 11